MSKQQKIDFPTLSEQLKVSAIPPDLLEETGIAGTEDAAAADS